MHKGLLVLLLPVCALVISALPGCQGGSRAIPGTEVEDQPEFADLLPSFQELSELPAKREPAYSEYDLITNGKYFYTPLFNQRVAVSGNSAQFSPQFGETHGRTLNNLAYCMYLFYIDSSFAEEDEIHYGWEVPPADISKAWMGVGHNGAERWNWFRCNAQGRQHVMSLGGYFNSDPLFVMFVLADDQPALLRYIRLGTPTTEAHIHTSPNKSFTPLAAVFDASGSTTGVGPIVKYDWDWNNDGVFEQTTGDVAVANHTYTEVGTYRPAVRVTNEYGEQDTASMEVLVAAEWTHSWGLDSNELVNGVCADSELSCYGVGRIITAENKAELLLLKWDLAGNLVWARSWGGPESDEGVDIVADSSGDLYVLGKTSSFGAGGADILLQRWDANGDLAWSRTWGGNTTDTAYSFSQRDGDLYIAGQTKSFGHSNGDALVLKFSSSGDLQWARSVGEGYSDMALAIRAFKPYSLQYTGVHVAGSTASYKAPGSGQDVLYMKFTADGDLTRVLTWSGGISQTARAVSVSGLMGESIHVCGSSSDDLLLLEVGTGGGLMSRAWDSGTTDSATDMVRLSEGFLICGLTGVGTSDENALLLNLSLQGAVQGCELWDLAGTKDSWQGIGGHPGGVVVGGYALMADGGSWSNFSGSIDDISGSWVEHNLDSAEPDGHAGSPAATAQDITSEGVIDTGDGVDLDVLMAARAVL